jgi:hypothetical protein
MFKYNEGNWNSSDSGINFNELEVIPANWKNYIQSGMIPVKLEVNSGKLEEFQ